MEITHFGDNRSRITVVYAPLRIVVQPRIIDGTRWLLLAPDLLGELQQRLMATPRRTLGIAGATRDNIVNRPYLLEAHPITHHNGVTIYRFGRMASSVTLIRTHGTPLQVSRVGSANMITADHESVLWLKALIERSPRGSSSAVAFFREHGLTLTSRILAEQFRPIPRNGSS